MKTINRFNTQLTRSAALLMAIIIALGCEPGNKAAAPAPASPEGTAAAAGKAGAVAPKGPCEDYGVKLCEVVGAESPTCGAVKSTVDLMPVSACTAGIAGITESKTKYAAAREVCTTLMNTLCKAVGDETKTCAMVKEQTVKFPPERCKMMMGEDQLPKIIKDLTAMEAANKPLDAEKQALIAANSTTFFGPENAAVTLVIFSDFQCPYCTKAATAVDELKKKYVDKVRFVFRQFPLSFHQKAGLAAQAALAASAQGKFWEMHDKMFANQQALERADLEKYAKEVGLDVAKFKKELDAETYKAAVEADTKMGTDIGVQGTPSVFLNGARVGNPTDAAAIGAEIEAALGNPTAPVAKTATP